MPAALAAANPKPDIVIVGHTHREVRDTVINGVHFVQPKNWAQSLAVVHVLLRKRAGQRGAATASPVSTSDLIPLSRTSPSYRGSRGGSDAAAPGRAPLGRDADRQGSGRGSTVATRASRTRRCSISSMKCSVASLARSCRRRRRSTRRSGLPEGEIHQRDVSGIYPYENTLRAVKISGQQLREYLEHSARVFPHVRRPASRSSTTASRATTTTS